MENKNKWGEIQAHFTGTLKKQNIQVTINGRKINTNTGGKFPGLKLQVRGISDHSTDIINTGKAKLSKLKRFHSLATKSKTTLVKSLLIPVLQYPPIHSVQCLKQKVIMQEVFNSLPEFYQLQWNWKKIKETHKTDTKNTFQHIYKH